MTEYDPAYWDSLRANRGDIPRLWPFPARLLDYPSAPPLSRPPVAPIAPPPNAPEAPF